MNNINLQTGAIEDSDLAVLIPVYNNQVGFERTLLSVLEEKGDYLVLAVDDGSTPPLHLPDGIQAGGNVTIVRCDKNGGITRALNIGLQIAKQYGIRYIARIDAGDLHIVGRFKLQRTFLKTAQCDLVGGWAICQSENDPGFFIRRYPADLAAIKQMARRNNPFLHSAVMFDLDTILRLGGYPEGYPAAEDFALWSRVIKAGKAANLPTPVVKKVISPNSISAAQRTRQIRSRLRITVENGALRSPSGWAGFLANLLLQAISLQTSTHIKTVLSSDANN